MSDDVIDLIGEEMARATGALGVEKAPWYSEALMRRVSAEIQRVADSNPFGTSSVVINVGTPERVEEILGVMLSQRGHALAEVVRASGTGPEGLAWPGHRESLARQMESGWPAGAAMLRQPTPDDVLFLCVHYVDGGRPLSVVVPLTVTIQAPRHVASA